MRRHSTLFIVFFIALCATALLCACSPKEAAQNEAASDNGGAVAKDAASTESAPVESTPMESASSEEPSTKVTVAEPASSENGTKAERQVVARVNGTPIYRDELDGLLNSLRDRKAMTQNGGQGGMPTLTADEQMTALNRLIDRDVLLVAAAKANTVVSDEEVSAKVEELKKRYGDEMLKNLLGSRGMAVEDLPKAIRDDLMRQKFIESQTKDITPSDEDVQKAYDELKAKGVLKQPETMDVAHILIMTDESRKAPSEDSAAESPEGSAKGEGSAVKLVDKEAIEAAAKAKIDKAYKRVTEGKEDFAAVAKDMSEDPGSKENGGKYEGVPRGQMVPEFEKTMIDTPLNEVSKPFKTQYGWHILKPLAKHEAGDASLDEIKTKLTDYVKGKLATEKLDKLAAEARPDAKIEILFKPTDETAGPAMGVEGAVSESSVEADEAAGSTEATEAASAPAEESGASQDTPENE